MTLRELAQHRGEVCPDSIADVEISIVGEDPNLAKFASDDPIALMTAVCLYLLDGGREFLTSGPGYAIVENVS